MAIFATRCAATTAFICARSFPRLYSDRRADQHISLLRQRPTRRALLLLAAFRPHRDLHPPWGVHIHRLNCEFAGYADPAFAAQNVNCKAVYWSERDVWTLAMVAAGISCALCQPTPSKTLR